GPGVPRPRLRPRRGDAVVPDHRRREAHQLLRVARVGDDLLVARHRGGEDRFPEGDVLRADRATVEDRPVFENQEARHAEYASFPFATVSRILPLRVWPISQEFGDRDRKPLSSTRHVRSGARTTRLAGAPTAIRGLSSP